MNMSLTKEDVADLESAHARLVELELKMVVLSKELEKARITWQDLLVRLKTMPEAKAVKSATPPERHPDIVMKG